MKYGNRSPWKKYVTSPITLALLIIILVVLVRATSNISHKAELGAAKLAQAQAEYQKLEDRQADLSTKVTHLSSEDGLESEIRAKFRAVKEGESVAVIVDDQQAAVVEATSTVKVGWWKKFMGFFGL
ncbi:MAG: septum formation initiator family protein [Patescibacteria group bacterium]